MFKIDSDGATVDNKFTNGNPALTIPATVVSDEWLNSVQGELVKVIEENGITLAKANEGQLNEALLEFFLRGGIKAPLSIVIANNSGPLDVTGFLMNKTTMLAKISMYSIERKTATQSKRETGLIFCTYNSKDDAWTQGVLSVHDDSGLTFSIDNTDTDAAQLEWTTDDLTGATYVGNLNMTAIFEIRV